MTSHLEDGTIHELIDGEIPSTSLAPIRAHLASCPECRARIDIAQGQVDETDILIEALDDRTVSARAPNVVPIAAPRSHAWVRNAAWAASLVIAVGAGYYGRGNPVRTASENPAILGVREGPAAGEPLNASQQDALTSRPDATPGPVPEPPASRPSATPAGSATATTTNPAIRREVTTDAAGAATGQLTPPPATAPAPSVGAAAAPPSRARLGEGVSVESRRALASTANQFAARDQAAMKQVMRPPTDTIDFTRAVSVMGGRLLLITGMVPVRLELEGSDVRVIYRVIEGELVLVQSVRAGEPSHRLIAPPGFPADSLAALQRRINR